MGWYTNPFSVFMWLIVSGAIILVILGGIAFRTYFKTEGTAAHQADVAAQIQDTPHHHEVTALQLESDYKLDDETAAAKYDGKVVLLNGLLKHLVQSEKRSAISRDTAPYVAFYTDSDAWTVECLLPEDEYQTIRDLPGYPSLRLQMKGMVKGFEERLLRIRVEGCRLQQTLLL
jgi:hypothetical protein